MGAREAAFQGSLSVLGGTCPENIFFHQLYLEEKVKNNSVLLAPLFSTYLLLRNSWSSLEAKKKKAWFPLDTSGLFFQEGEIYNISDWIYSRKQKNKKQKGVESWALESGKFRKFNDGIHRNYIIWKCYKKAKRMRSVFG